MEELIIKYLFEGKTQNEIADILKQQGVTPNSLSSIEKSLKKIKSQHKANTMFHLAAILCGINKGKNTIIAEHEVKTSKIPVLKEFLPIDNEDTQKPIEYKGYLIKLGENGFYFQDKYGAYTIELLKEWNSIKDEITERFYALNPHLK